MLCLNQLAGATIITKQQMKIDRLVLVLPYKVPSDLFRYLLSATIWDLWCYGLIAAAFFNIKVTLRYVCGSGTASFFSRTI